MKVLAVVQLLLATMLLLVSPVASEMGWLPAAWLASAGVLGIAGSIGLLRKNRAGWFLSLAAHAVFGIPAALLCVTIALNLAHGATSLESAGRFFYLLVLVPTVFAAFLWMWRREAT